MCGRFAFYSPAEAVSRLFGVDEAPEVEPRYNIAPTQYIPTVRAEQDGKRGLALLRWGLVPFWAKDLSIGNRMINARAETVAAKPAFRTAFRRRRCLLLANGFYEWQAGADGKTPHYISLKSAEPFAMAGLWESWQSKQDADAEPVDTCCIITTGPNALMQTIHHRMPVILRPADYDVWLDPANDNAGRLGKLLVPYDAGVMQAHPVPRTVNNARNEGAELIQAV